MKIDKKVNLVLTSVFLLLSACRSLGELQLETEQVSVTVANYLSAKPQTVQTLREEQLVETLHRYLTHRLEKMRVRSTIRVSVSINSFEIAPNASHIGAHVVVSEKGNTINTFDEREFTVRSSATNKLSKGLARRIYLRLKDL